MFRAPSLFVGRGGANPSKRVVIAEIDRFCALKGVVSRERGRFGGVALELWRIRPDFTDLCGVVALW